MRLLAFITASIYLLVYSGCGFTRKSIKENNSSIKVSSTSPSGEYFIAKKDSILFHKPDCKFIRATGYVIDPDNIVVFPSSREAKRTKYISCPLCKPDFNEDVIMNENRQWFVFLLCLLGLAFLDSSSVAASFNGAEGFMLEISND